jgi:two-component system chemotaxis response regulator CheB
MSGKSPVAPHLVVVGSSAGGLKAMVKIFSALPRDLPAPILIVQHLSPNFVSRLASILSTATGYPAVQAQAGMELKPGMAYIAPPDHHMVVDEAERIQLRSTGYTHFTRPSIDALFCSVAPNFKARTIGVVLTGGGSDGTEGARVIREHGGKVIVQSQDTAEHAGMPGSVIEGGYADFIEPIEHISERIVALTGSND